ncbi:MAG: methyltransferase domain-containing protein [Akkermansiaceae bacterium]|nr:methyltransferase domain-containing protein [Akkermansiaceae bacterium]
MPKNLYDDLDLLYREIWGRSLHHGAWVTGHESIEEAREKLIELALKQLDPKGTIADIGCGYGILAHKILDQYHCEVFANTNSEKQAAQITPHPGLTILQGDWLQQQLEPKSLSGIIAIESLSHFDSFEDFLKHTLPALKPGGRIVICDWFSETGSYFFLRQLATTGNLPPWRSIFSLSSNATDLKKVHSQDLSREVAPTWSALFWRSIQLPLRKPSLLVTLLKKIITRPSLLLAFPLIRLAYQTGDLEYRVIAYEK